MSQQLTAFPALASPVPAVTSAATLSANIAQLADLNERQVLAVSVISLIYLLWGKGGTDYRSSLSVLQSDTATMMEPLGLIDFFVGPSVFARLQAAIDWNAGYAEETTLGTDVETLLINSHGLQDLPESTLWHEIIFLRYKLSILAV
jgi:hypothetical protein